VGFADHSNFQDIAEAIAKHEGRPGVNCFFTPNPLTPAALNRKPWGELAAARQGQSTKDSDIARRRWLLVDVDPRRPSSTSATSREKTAAHSIAERIRRDMTSLGWPPPIFADSGNGIHLCWRIDEPTGSDLPKRVLKSWARYTTPAAKVDQSVHNAARIWKLYGTTATKGAATADRPHRRSHIIDEPAQIAVVSTKQLEEQAGRAAARAAVGVAVAAAPSEFPRGPWSPMSVLAAIRRTGMAKPMPSPPHGGEGWLIDPCPMIGERHGGDSPTATAAGIGADGIPWFRCHGERCGERGWADLVELAYPGYSRRRDEQKKRWDDRQQRHQRATAKARQEDAWIESGVRQMTDLGNAQRFRDDHIGSARYIVLYDRWYIWDHRRWCPDERLGVIKLAHETVTRIRDEADQARDDPDLIERIVKHATRSQSDRAISAMVRQARPYLALEHHELDRDPFALNLHNGTFDLKAGKLRPYCRDDFLTKIAGTRYDPDAKAPTWDAFLNRIFDGDTDLIEFTRRAVGYSLSGDVSEEKMMFLWGAGANGKTTFANCVAELAGDYACVAHSELFEVKAAEPHPTAIADLYGARFASSVETEEGRRMSEKRVKQLTSRDRRLKARRMRQDFFEFAPTHKLWIAGNHRPRIIGTDHGIWRRMMLLPFIVAIPEGERDRHLDEKLRRELPGVLNWALAGFREWVDGGLRPPPAVLDATKEYREEEDTLGRFIDERCQIGEGLRVRAVRLYEAFVEWSETEGERRWTRTTIGRKLTDMGYRRLKSNGIWRLGITLQRNGGTVEG